MMLSSATMSASPMKLSLDSLLAQIGIFLKACPKVTLEWSLRVGAGTMSDSDRMTCWVEGNPEGNPKEGFVRVSQLLQAIAAPPSVQTIQATQSPISVRQGISVALLEHGIEWRLYLHTREPDATDRYQSWRWRSVDAGSSSVQSAVQTDRYEFHFLPATPAGKTPVELVNPLFVDATQTLVQHERLRSMSGFWLRHRGDQVLQVDLIYPWYPQLSEFDSTLRSLVTTIGGSDTWITKYADYPIRHIAFNGKDREPGFTLYFSAPFSAPIDMGPKMDWPSTLQTLKERVCAHSQKIQRHMEQTLFSRLPAKTTPARTKPPAKTLAKTTDTRISIGKFYDTQRIDLWRQVLGNKMHYHFGLFEDSHQLPERKDAMDETAIAAAFDRAVSELYPFIPSGSRVYDIGCGWGGPALQLRAERGCQVEGITISQTQAQYCTTQGLQVRHGNAEETFPPGYFDCMIMMESLCHVQDKLRLLKSLRLFGKKLVIRAHCQDRHPTSRNFGGTMLMNSSPQLRSLVEQAGWTIVHWQNRRLESMPSVLVWQQRLRSIPPSDDRHLETLRDFCNRVVTHWDKWGESNPLIELVAE